MDLSKKRLRAWLLFYAATLAACGICVWIVSLFAPVGVWHHMTIGVWLMLCIASLNCPDHIWDRWIS